jgi:hypothetical protein
MDCCPIYPPFSGLTSKAKLQDVVLHLPNSNALLEITLILKAKCKFHAAALLFKQQEHEPEKCFLYLTIIKWRKQFWF